MAINPEGQSLFWLFTALLFGLAIGSFLNVVIYRLPKMMERDWAAQCAELRGEEINPEPVFNLAVPRSRCPHCGHAISALENIPLLSWLVLKGRCRQCKSHISIRYPLVELFTGLMFAACVAQFGPTTMAVAAMGLVAVLIAAAMIDFDTTLLPDDLTLPLLWAGLLVNLGGMFVPLASAVVGAMAGYLVLWLVFWAFKLLTGKEGMGYGDFKLLGALGAWFGWQALPVLILLSSLVGAVVGVGLMLFAKHGRDVPIPFGPYLAGAGLAALFFGQALQQLLFAI